METIRSLRTLRGLLLLLTIVGAVVAWVILSAPTTTVRGEPPAAPPNAIVDPQPNVPKLKIDEDQDEIDPEACATTILKIIEGPVAVDNPFLLDPVPASGVLREQTIAQVIQACNVDDEIRPPNLDRDLDVDIEVFSIICEKAVDLSVTARCEVLRVAQKENAPFLP